MSNLRYRFLDRKELQTLVLGEHDDIFVKYRHQHITAVSKGVSEELRKFSKDNAAAQYAAAGGKKASEKDIAGAIRGLPQYKEMLTKVRWNLGPIPPAVLGTHYVG